MKPATDRPAAKRLEKGQETRRAIIDTAMRLFAERGYAAVSIETVLAACHISRGALYHHFASKEALLEAVFEAVEVDVTAKVLESAPSASGAVAAVRAGRHAFGLMKAALEPAAKEAGIPATLVDAFAHMLLASLSEIALLIAEADDASSALENGKGAVRELLDRILARPA